MLEKVQQLGDSVTREQINKLKGTLGDELYGLLDHAFDSETEDEAKDRVDAFVSSAKKSPLKVLRVRKILSPEQKGIIMEFLGD
jgi:hypothetical protein